MRLASLLRKKNDVAAAKATMMIPTMIIAVQVTSVTSKSVAISPDMARYEIKRNDGTQRKNWSQIFEMLIMPFHLC
jgi:hypothetical protein